MKFVVDMNLSPTLCLLLLHEAGWEATHWSSIGSVSALDQEIMQWALAEHRVVLTHDLDFGALLAATGAGGPSVVQVRAQDVRPHALAPLLIPILREHEAQLEAGALVIVDEARFRVRILPLIKR